MTAVSALGPVVWAPDNGVVARANLTRLLRKVGLQNYRDLLAESIERPGWYWDVVVEDMKFEFFNSYTDVVDAADGPEWSRWFIGGTTNIAWNSCHRWADLPAFEQREAVVSLKEDGRREQVSFGELSKRVTQVAEWMSSVGLCEGDRVALFLPLGVEAVIASHACAHLGVVQVPIFTGFGLEAIVERLRDSQAKAVITANATLRRGVSVPLASLVAEACLEAPEVLDVLVWTDHGESLPSTGNAVFHDWKSAVSPFPGKLAVAAVSSEHPYMLMYTSGTTGRPKGVIHTHAGFGIPVASHATYQCDVQASDTTLFITDMGWVMGPWTIVSSGFCGAKQVYFEGAHDATPDRLWKAIESERISVLGLSPTVARSLARACQSLPHDLSSLRVFFTTGECWDRPTYMWLLNEVGRGKLPIINASGGTEAGVLLTCCILEPIKCCSVGLPAPATDVAVFSSRGEEVVGEVGELVCRAPWPSITRGLWNSPSRYYETYWTRFPGIYWHGDWAVVDDDGYWWLLGRSDDTLNVAGKRVGPAEIEELALQHPIVAEVAAIGVPHDVKGEVIWIFCRVDGSRTMTPEDEQAISELIATGAGKPFRPEQVISVSALPKTQSQKIVRSALRDLVRGNEVAQPERLQDPEVLAEIRALISMLHEKGREPRGKSSDS